MLMELRFTGIIFGLLLVMHAPESYSVHAHDGENTIEERTVSAQKEALDGFGGRRMGGHEVDAGASKNSGNSNDAEIMSVGKFQDQAKTQAIGMNKLEPRTRDLAGLGIPRSTTDQPFHLPKLMQFEHSKVVFPPKTSLERLSRSEKLPASQEPPVIGKEVESKRLLDATKEIVNLIHKDYRGNSIPRRMPPINNHVPRH